MRFPLLFDKYQIFRFDSEFDLIPRYLDEGVEVGEMAGLQFHYRVRVGCEIVLEAVDAAAITHEVDDAAEQFWQDDFLIGD